MTVHYLPNARPEPDPGDERRGDVVHAHRRRSRRRWDALAPAADAPDDNTAWLVTFSDLVILLFGFVVLSVTMTHSAPAAASKDVETVSPPIARDERPRIDPVEPNARLAHAVLPVAPLTLRDPPIAEPPATNAIAIEPETIEPEAVEPETVEPKTVERETDEQGQSRRFDGLAHYLRAFAKATGTGDAVSVASDGTGVDLALGNDLGFGSGRVALDRSALPLLREIGGLVREMPDVTLEVTGHTDSTPVHTRAYPSNLELSLARAAVVAHAIAGDDDALAARIVTAGFADHRGIASNALPSDRARNRRVELRLLRR